MKLMLVQLTILKKGRVWCDVKSELNNIIYNIKPKNIHVGVNNASSKLTEIQVSEIKNKLLNKSLTIKSIAEEYDVSSTLIGHIKRGKLWGHVI